MARRHTKEGYFGIYTENYRRDGLAEQTRFAGHPGAPKSYRQEFKPGPVNPKKLGEKMYENMMHRANKGVPGSRARSDKAYGLYAKILKKYNNEKGR